MEPEGLSGLPAATRVRVEWAEGRGPTTFYEFRGTPLPRPIVPLYWTKDGWSNDGVHGGVMPTATFQGVAIAFSAQEGVLVIEDSGRLAILPPEQLRVME